MISRRYLAQFKVSGQSQQGFMPVVGSNPGRRRPSLKKQSRTQSKVQLTPADRVKSLSFEIVQASDLLQIKKEKPYLSYSESKTHHKRKSLHLESSEVIRNLLDPQLGTKGISISLPTEGSSSQIEEHLALLRKLVKSLQLYEMQRKSDTVQKNAIAYYNSKTNLDRYIQCFPILIRKELYSLVNIERCTVIVLMEICLLNKLQKMSKYVADVLIKILQQYKRFALQLEKLKKNESPSVSSAKIRFKMKTPGLIIKAENYKIYEAFRMAMAPLEISFSLKQLIKNLEPSDPKQFWYMVREFYAYHLCLKTLNKPVIRQDYWQFATCPEPYLPIYDGYTLVLDLDETLAYFNQATNQVMIRPFTNEFLGMMRNYFQIVVFTAGMPDYAEYLISHIEQKDCISYKLYRHHTTRTELDKTIKDLDRLGRPLTHVLMIDNLPHNFSKQPHNGIEIESWYGNPEDNELKKIMKHLMSIYQTQCDVRSYIRNNFPSA